MARVEKEIEVNVPVRTAYNQWTQFEEFPSFMEGVSRVQQLDDTHLAWEASFFGREKKWEAEIREQVPDRLIVWNSTDGTENAGAVAFEPIDGGSTRIKLRMSYDTDGMVESTGDALGFVSRRVEGDLERFRTFIEARGQETGGWRETVQNPDVPGGHTAGRI